MENENDAAQDNIGAAKKDEAGLNELEARNLKKETHKPSERLSALSVEGPDVKASASKTQSHAESLPSRNAKSRIARFIGIFIIALIAGGGASIFFEQTKSKSASSDASDLTVESQTRPPGAPDCWQGNDGYRFAYVDNNNQRQLVDTLEEVPRLYRAGASCRKE